VSQDFSVLPQSPQQRTPVFVLDPAFVASYETRESPFGFNGLGHFVFLRTYSRARADGAKETWPQTVERVVNGTYNMQKNWVESNDLGWNAAKAQRSAQEMFERIFALKFTPPGRGLWAMGSPITEERGLFAALNNCAFVSTENILTEGAKPFVFLMDSSMLGIGVGFDTKGAGTMLVSEPIVDSRQPTPQIVIPDSRDGWIKSTQMLIESYLFGTAHCEFDYSRIRPAGAPIRTFGGVSAGPGPLRDLHGRLREVLDRNVNQPITVTTIVDMMNHIGVCVVSGNVRRSAEIAFGKPDDDEYVDLKNYEKNPQRGAYGWTSNNSVFATVGMDYGSVCERVQQNGEPGFAWLDNMRKFSRMNGLVDNRDHRAMGGNPCLEQTLEPFEMCCLVETFPARHSSLEDYKRTLKFAYLYAKTVTLGRTHWPETNRVMLRNRRIGCSISGVAQFITQHGINNLKTWCNEGYDTIQTYDRIYSEWLAIPRSIKTTSIKPSGTVSLLAGATPGMHYPISRFYVRRVRVPISSDLLPPLRAAGYHIEPCVGSEATTVVVEFPVDAGPGIRSESDVSMWEQLHLAAFLQREWADNQVSCTVTFEPPTEGPQIQHALNYMQYALKGISFLPRFTSGYAQMPYEAISEAQFLEINAGIQTGDPFHVSAETPMHAADAKPELFCDGDSCTL
jgi:ribonucleotide reductase alpha subunit